MRPTMDPHPPIRAGHADRRTTLTRQLAAVRAEHVHRDRLSTRRALALEAQQYHPEEATR